MNANAPDEIHLALSKAEDAIRAGQMEEAAGICRQLLTISPAQPNALHILGLVALAARRNDEALGLLEDAARPDTNNALLFMRLGIARALSKQTSVLSTHCKLQPSLRQISTTCTSI